VCQTSFDQNDSNTVPVVKQFQLLIFNMYILLPHHESFIMNCECATCIKTCSCTKSLKHCQLLYTIVLHIFDHIQDIEKGLTKIQINDTLTFSSASDMKIKSLTKADILDKINNKNISQIFLKERTIQRKKDR